MQEEKKAEKAASSRRAVDGTARYRRYTHFAPCNYLRLPLARGRGKMRVSVNRPPPLRRFFRFFFTFSRIFFSKITKFLIKIPILYAR
ncbi:MAG: hypothetical protein II814_14025 [Treponema sp.]|nr:hypothetical protein [Treponema sp.]